MKESLEENKIALGAAFGVVFGAIIDNVGLGIALGAGVGSRMQKEGSSSVKK